MVGQFRKKHHENGLKLQHATLKAKISVLAPHTDLVRVYTYRHYAGTLLCSSSRYLRKPFPGKQLAKAFPVVT
jgi:hypothetical protein